MRYLVVFLLFTSACFAQNAKTFTVKLHQYDYPAHPLPAGGAVYGVSTDVADRSVFAYDYRGERIVLSDMRTALDRGSSSADLIPKLYSFSRYHDPKIPYENGFLLSMEMTDVELFHEPTGEADLFNINSAFEVYLSVTYQNRTVFSDSLNFEETVGTFASPLSKKDVHIVATNKALEMAEMANSLAFGHATYAFRNAVIDWVDFSFETQYIPFYGISKAKKLKNGERTKQLEERIKALAEADADIHDRSLFDAEVQSLLEEFMLLADTEDYRKHDDFQLYVHGNIASLSAIAESYDDAMMNYRKALSYQPKWKLENALKAGVEVAGRNAERKAVLFHPDGTLKPGNSEQYYIKRNNREKEIN